MVASKKETARKAAPSVEVEVVVEPSSAVDCPWCHTSTNKLHRRSGCGEG